MSYSEDELKDNIRNSEVKFSKNTEKLLKQREDDEIEYQKMLSKRPHGGSGKLGGNRNNNNTELVSSSNCNSSSNSNSSFIPCDYNIMKTMQDLDVNWEEAKQFLINEKELNYNSKVIIANNDTESYNLRKLRLSNINNNEKEKINRREEANKRIQLIEQQAIDEKKEKLRLQGLRLLEREQEEKEKLLFASQSGSEHRKAVRLSRFGGNDNDNIKMNVSDNNIPVPPEPFRWNIKSFDKLKTTNQQMDISVFGNNNDNKDNNNSNNNSNNNNNINNSSYNCNNAIETAATATFNNNNNNNNKRDNLSYLSSDDWIALLSLTDSERLKVIQSMLKQTIIFENSNHNQSSIPNIKDAIEKIKNNNK